MNPINIFIAYARKDTPFLQQLRVYLRPISRNKNIRIWYDGEIVPGTKWEENIKKHLYEADIILLLMSADALNSDFFYDIEMKRALEQHQSGKSIVIPVILSHCLWDEPELQLIGLQALPQDGKAIKDWVHESKAYDNIARGVRRSIELVLAKRKEKVRSKKNKLKKEKQIEASKQAHSEQSVEEKAKKQVVNSLATLEEKSKTALNKSSNQAKNQKSPLIHTLKSVLYTLTIGVLVFFAIITIYRSNPGMFKQKKNTQIQKLIDDMVSIKGGTFTMGCVPKRDGKCEDDEKPAHQVTLSDFKIGKFEVTQAQWEVVMGGKPKSF